MKVLEGEATLKKRRGSFSKTSSARSAGILGALISLMPPSNPYCEISLSGLEDWPCSHWLRTCPVKTGAREASSFCSSGLSKFRRLRWYTNLGSTRKVIRGRRDQER